MNNEHILEKGFSFRLNTCITEKVHDCSNFVRNRFKSKPLNNVKAESL